MNSKSIQQRSMILRSRQLANRLQHKERPKAFPKVNWEWYGAWAGFFCGALTAAGSYYFASGRPSSSTGLAPGFPVVVLGAAVGAVLCGTARSEWPDNSPVPQKLLRLLYRAFVILAALFYVALMLSAAQSLSLLPAAWQLPF